MVTVRACVHEIRHPAHASAMGPTPWDPTRADTWPQVAERELGNLVYPGRE